MAYFGGMENVILAISTPFCILAFGIALDIIANDGQAITKIINAIRGK